jgi:hypothetical protein
MSSKVGQGAYAKAFVSHLVAREPYRLRDLAVRMRDTGGPVEAMDASLASLGPLWEWFVAYVLSDCPGVPDDVRLSRWPRLDDDSAKARAVRRRAAAAEGLEHYLRLVLQCWEPPAEWTVLVGNNGPFDLARHEPGITRPQGSIIPTGFLLGLAQAIPENTRGARGPEELLRQVVIIRLNRQELPVEEALPSVLAPYLTMDLPPMPEIAQIATLARLEAELEAELAAAAATAPPPEPRVGSEEVLARGPGIGLEEPWLLAPLPAQTVAAGLTAAGFTSQGTERVLPADLLVDGGEVHHRDQAAVITTLVHDGELRALHLEPVNDVPSLWDPMHASLADLARALGAHLGLEDDLD